eukprot:463770_1
MLRAIPKIILWTAPRCISSAFERAIMEISTKLYDGNGKIFHEPFCVPYYFGAQKISKRGNEDLYIDSNHKHITYNDTIRMITAAEHEKNFDFIFIKDMAYSIVQFDPENDFYSHLLSNTLCSPQWIHTFLIRKPHKSILSLYKASTNSTLTGWTSFNKEEIGFNELYSIYLKCVELRYNNIIIVDADELLNDPEYILGQYCNCVGLQYENSVLNWECGPQKEFKREGWHIDVINSTGFYQKNSDESDINNLQLPDSVLMEIDKAFIVYNKMYAQRLNQLKQKKK